MKVVIMAGGRGKRLWPMSRRDKPKQFQALVTEQTMLQDTYDRLALKFAPGDIFIATNKDYEEEVATELPDLPRENIIAETANRDTASCIALTCAVISARDAEATVAIFSSDHVIKNPQELLDAVDAADAFIMKNPEYIVTFGITPTEPEIGYGYIKKGSELAVEGKYEICEAEKFVEKPDRATAEEYLADGSYFWNAGMFVFRVDHMISKYATYLPDSHKRLIAIKDAIGTDDFSAVLEKEYQEMDKISVDYGIMENEKKIAVLPLALAWSDVGSWSALKEMLVAEKSNNLERGEHYGFGSENLVIYSEKPVVTIGAKDLVIIERDDVLLVCTQDEAKNLSKVVEALDNDGKGHLL